jgi:cobalamin biosynthesis Mg chelatase CobN
MKNLKQTMFSLVILTLLISSCSQKQLYTYNNFNQSKTSKSKISKTQKVEKTVAVEFVAPETVEVEVNQQEVVIQNTTVNDVANTENAQQSMVSAKRNISLSEPVNAPLKTFVKVPKKLNKVIQKMENKDSKREGGSSLLWVIIVVILILWLLGLIAGNFGGLLHLLLVIALILIILTLLGLI